MRSRCKERADRVVSAGIFLAESSYMRTVWMGIAVAVVLLGVALAQERPRAGTLNLPANGDLQDALNKKAVEADRAAYLAEILQLQQAELRRSADARTATAR